MICIRELELDALKAREIAGGDEVIRLSRTRIGSASRSDQHDSRGTKVSDQV
ncbi:MAG TPA: hypothetical protein VFN22_04340 [Gemmatimonadales bacterium]|nr:hypothetical protein [Gemmatimonadales bacterium]